MNGLMAAMVHGLGDLRLVRYGLASIVALAVDIGTFLTLFAGGMMATGASAIGYGAGIVAHWLISSRVVFVGTVAGRGIARTRQKAFFVISALAGLVLTTAIVWACDGAGVDPRAAKLVAIVVSFTATWVLRSHIVFRART